jgi:hypothetical protein
MCVDVLKLMYVHLIANFNIRYTGKPLFTNIKTVGTLLSYIYKTDTTCFL